MALRDADAIVSSLVSRRQLHPMQGSTTALDAGRTPFCVGIMVHSLVNMPLLSGCTKASIRLAVPSNSGFRFIDGNSDDSEPPDPNGDEGTAGCSGGVSELQDSESLSLAPSFSDLWLVSRDVPASTVAIISVSCIERVRKECVGTVGFLVVNLFGKRGTFVSRLHYGDDPSIVLNLENHRSSRRVEAMGAEQLTSPTIPLLGVKFTSFWGGGHPVLSHGQRSDAHLADERILSDFRQFYLQPGVRFVDQLQLTASEITIMKDRRSLNTLGFVADARPSTLNLDNETAEIIFANGAKAAGARWRALLDGEAASFAKGSDGASLHRAFSSFDKLGVTPFNALRGIVVSVHRILMPEPFPTPSAARESEVTVPSTALNQLCIFKVVVEVGGLLPGASSVDWTASTLTNPIFDSNKSTITVCNVPKVPGKNASSEEMSLMRRRSSVRFVSPRGDESNAADESDGAEAANGAREPLPQETTGPFEEFVRTKSGVAVVAVLRVYAILPKYEAIQTLATVSPEAVAGNDHSRDEVASVRLAQSALVRHGYFAFDPGLAAHWTVVPHSWGATMLVPKGQPFTVAQFYTEVPLFRGQPSDRQISELGACRDGSLEPLFRSWTQTKTAERCSSGMAVVVSSADASRAAEVRRMAQARGASHRPAGVPPEGVRLRDAMLLHQRVRTVKELEATTNAVFASAVFGQP
jgi:hypothetical protein